MSQIKLAVIYYSTGGTNYQLAQWAADAGKEAGAEVKILRVQELAPDAEIVGNPTWKAHVEVSKDVSVATPDDIVWADAIIFSTPTRFGNIPSQVKQFLDLTGGIWFTGKTANKVVSAMASAQNSHGGQEQTILQLYTSMYHWGAIIAAPGYTDQVVFGAGGNPYGTSVTVGHDGKMIEDVQAAVKYQAKRTVTDRMSLPRILLIGLFVALFSSTAVLLSVLAHGALFTLVIPFFFYNASIGISAPVFTTLAMGSYGHIAGSASALLGVFPLILGSITSPLVGIAGEYSALPLGILIFTSSLLSIIVYAGLVSFRKERWHMKGL